MLLRDGAERGEQRNQRRSKHNPGRWAHMVSSDGYEPEWLEAFRQSYESRALPASRGGAAVSVRAGSRRLELSSGPWNTQLTAPMARVDPKPLTIPPDLERAGMCKCPITQTTARMRCCNPRARRHRAIESAWFTILDVGRMLRQSERSSHRKEYRRVPSSRGAQRIACAFAAVLPDVQNRINRIVRYAC